MAKTRTSDTFWARITALIAGYVVHIIGIFAKNMPRGADCSELKLGPVVQFKAPLGKYKFLVLEQDTRSKNKQEQLWGAVGGYPKDKTSANHRLRLAQESVCPVAARNKHEAAWIAKVNKNQEEQAAGYIPDSLGIFVNGIVIEWSNWFFGGALDHHLYYLYLTNTAFVSDKAIAMKAFKKKNI
ncbi:hypothetical protein C0992_002616, partial [Termitomyces sp. T32_za158]